MYLNPSRPHSANRRALDWLEWPEKSDAVRMVGWLPCYLHSVDCGRAISHHQSSGRLCPHQRKGNIWNSTNPSEDIQGVWCINAVALCRTRGGLTTAVRRRMDTSVRRRPPPNQTVVPKRKRTRDASLYVMRLPLNWRWNYTKKKPTNLLFTVIFSAISKGSTRYGSFCYNIGSEAKTFDDAKKACSQAGAHLVDVTDR